MRSNGMIILHHTNVFRMSSKTLSQTKVDLIPKSLELNQDVYSVFENSISTYFNEVKASTESYLRAVTNLQEEIIELRKHNADSAIELQKEISEKFGTNTNLPDSTLEITKTIAAQNLQAWNMLNKMNLNSLDVLAKNIHAFNSNCRTFDNISKGIIDSWASTIKQAAKE